MRPALRKEREELIEREWSKPHFDARLLVPYPSAENGVASEELIRAGFADARAVVLLDRVPCATERHDRHRHLEVVFEHAHETDRGAMAIDDESRVRQERAIGKLHA